MSPKSKYPFFGRKRFFARAKYHIARLGHFLWIKWSQTRWLKALTLLLLSLFGALLLFPNVLEKPKIYQVGDIAKQDIKASRDFLVENEEVTEKKREQAAKEIMAVYDFDRSATYATSRIQEAFKVAREAVKRINAAALSGNTGEQIRIKERFYDTLAIAPDEAAFILLSEQQFPAVVEKAVIRLLRDVSKDGVISTPALLKEQIERGGILLHDVYSQSEIVVKDINRFHTPEGAKEFIKKQKRTLRRELSSPDLINVAVNLALALVKPNLEFNQDETERRKDAARASVLPIYDRVKKDEMIVRSNDPITKEHLRKLEEESRPQNRVEIVNRAMAMILLMILLFGVLYSVMLNGTRSWLRDERDLFFLVSALLTVFITVWMYHFVAEVVSREIQDIFPGLTTRALLFAMPLACGAMLVSIFQGVAVAAVFSLAATVFAVLILYGRFEFFLYFFIGSLTAAYGVRRSKTRGIIIKTGLTLGLINAFMSLAINVIYGNQTEILWAAALGFIGGILTGVIATGILPLIEMAFGFTTDVKLLELGNLDQPLLRELMVKAPGTYHHSVIVSNMVEATAETIQADSLLAKVSAYYHDIGKIKKPLYFIENQMSGENRHERLAPSMSSLILIAHVKDGVELAREYGLGREITNIIQQHHGTNLIAYFYHKAREMEEAKGDKGKRVEEEDYRYPGPKPQTKEASLVMLADMVEAAVRALTDSSAARIQGTVQKIISQAFMDGQLDECELSLKDLHEIAKGFNKTLSGIFHQRIEYPTLAVKAGKKGKNGSSDHFSTEEPRNKKPDDKTENVEGLKRLGL